MSNADWFSLVSMMFVARAEHWEKFRDYYPEAIALSEE